MTDLPSKSIPCPTCGGSMWLRQGVRSPHYRCEQYPKCDTVASAHSHPLRGYSPMGTPADRETRQARHMAHKAFDRLWRTQTAIFGSQSKARNVAYKYLASRMGMGASECHFAEFSLAQCERAIAICLSSDSRKVMSWHKERSARTKGSLGNSNRNGPKSRIKPTKSMRRSSTRPSLGMESDL